MRPWSWCEVALIKPLACKHSTRRTKSQPDFGPGLSLATGPAAAGGSKTYAGVAAFPSLLVPNGCQSGTTPSHSPKSRKPRTVASLPASEQASFNASLNRKRARFQRRAFIGVACANAKGYPFRWFVLTESDQALAAGLSMAKVWHNMVRWLRKVHGIDLQYLWVEHKQGAPCKVTGLQRSNVHVLTYGPDRLPLEPMKAYWKKHYLSTITGMELVKDIDKAIPYLAKYLSGEEKFVRARLSLGWVYAGWVQDTRNARRVTGSYPSDDTLAVLSKMTSAQREVFFTTFGILNRKKVRLKHGIGDDLS